MLYTQIFKFWTIDYKLFFFMYKFQFAYKLFKYNFNFLNLTKIQKFVLQTPPMLFHFSLIKKIFNFYAPQRLIWIKNLLLHFSSTNKFTLNWNNEQEVIETRLQFPLFLIQNKQTFLTPLPRTPHFKLLILNLFYKYNFSFIIEIQKILKYYIIKNLFF